MIFLTIFAPPNRGIYLICIGESVAQQVEHNTFNVGVPGSSPGGFTKINEQQITSAAFFVYTLLQCQIEISEDCLKRLLGLKVKLVKSISNHRLILAIYYVSWLKSTYTQQG